MPQNLRITQTGFPAQGACLLCLPAPCSISAGGAKRVWLKYRLVIDMSVAWWRG